MGIDLTSVRTLLAVNGVGPDATPEEITKLLAAAKYTPEEITSALALLAQPAAPRPSTITVSAADVPANMRRSSYPAVAATVHEESVLSPIGRGIGILIALLLVGGLALMAEKTYTSLMFVLESYVTSPDVIVGYVPYAAGTFVGALVLLIVAWRIARHLYGTRSFSLWLSLAIGCYVVIWFSLTFALVPAVVSMAAIPAEASVAIGLMIGIVVLFAHAAMLISSLIGAVFSLSGWKKDGAGKGMFWSVFIGLVAIIMLVYASGALRYPAVWFKSDLLCYGVPGSVGQFMCIAEAAPEKLFVPQPE